MQDNMDRHFAGTSNIGREEITGELICNKESGVTLLNLVKQLDDASAIGKSYGNLDIIAGVLNSETLEKPLLIGLTFAAFCQRLQNILPETLM